MNEVVRSQCAPLACFVKVLFFLLFFFFFTSRCPLWDLVRATQTVGVVGSIFSFPPTALSRVVALMPLWPGDWELSITGWRTGSLLKKAHVGQKEGWQECGRPAEWREGRQLATALSELFYLSSWSPRAIVRAV